jgi:hypothetical protein
MVDRSRYIKNTRTAKENKRIGRVGRKYFLKKRSMTGNRFLKLSDFSEMFFLGILYCII